MTRQRKICLTMQQRMDAIKDLETSNIAYVAEKYKVSPRTIARIKRNAVKIKNFAKRGILEKHRKNLRESDFGELEQRLYVWFAESRAIGNCVTDATLLEKAAELKKEFASCSKAKLSKGWISNFKRRRHIRLVRSFGVKTIAFVDDDNSFVSSDEEEKLTRTFEDMITDNEESNKQRDKKGDVEQRDEDRAAEEGDKKGAVEEGVEERATVERVKECAAEEGVEERATEERVKECAAEERVEERATEERVKECAAEEGVEEGAAAEVDEEGTTEEANEEHGVNLPPKIRKIFEDSFNDMEPCKKYIPPSLRCILDGLKLTILGGTYNKK